MGLGPAERCSPWDGVALPTPSPVSKGLLCTQAQRKHNTSLLQYECISHRHRLHTMQVEMTNAALERVSDYWRKLLQVESMSEDKKR